MADWRAYDEGKADAYARRSPKPRACEWYTAGYSAGVNIAKLRRIVMANPGEPIDQLGWMRCRYQPDNDAEPRSRRNTGSWNDR